MSHENNLDRECSVKVRDPGTGQVVELVPLKVWVLAPKGKHGVNIGLFKSPVTGKYFRSALPKDYPEYCIQRINKEYGEGESIQGVEAGELEASSLLKSLEECLDELINYTKKYVKFSKEVESRNPENPYASLVSMVVFSKGLAMALSAGIVSLAILIEYLATKLGVSENAFYRVLAKLKEFDSIIDEYTGEGDSRTPSLSQLLYELEHKSMGNG